MAMFRARISFSGLRGFEVGRLNRIILKLGAGPGGTNRCQHFLITHLKVVYETLTRPDL